VILLNVNHVLSLDEIQAAAGAAEQAAHAA
jgi:hypothetical protein